MGARASKQRPYSKSQSTGSLGQPRLGYTSILNSCYAGDGKVALVSVDGSVVTVDVASLNVKHIGKHTGAANRVVSANGSLFTCSRDKTLAQWAYSGGRIQCFEGHELNVTAVAVRNSVMASGARDQTVRTWDIAQGAQLWSTRLPRNIVTCLCWIPGTACFAQGSEDLHLRVWDERSRTMAQIMGNYEYFPLCAHASDDGHLIVTGSKGCDGQGGDIRVWDRRKAEILYHLDGHAQDTTACLFCPEWIFEGHRDALPHCNVNSSCQLLVSTSKDSTIKFWDLASPFRQPFREIDLGHSGMYTGLSIATLQSEVAITATTFDGGLYCFSRSMDLRSVLT